MQVLGVWVLAGAPRRRGCRRSPLPFTTAQSTLPIHIRRPTVSARRLDLIQAFLLPSRYGLVVDPFLPKLHEIRASEADLCALARLWRWERTVRRRLPAVIADGNFRMLFQSVFGLHGGVPLVRGYEALAQTPR